MWTAIATLLEGALFGTTTGVPIAAQLLIGGTLRQLRLLFLGARRPRAGGAPGGRFTTQQLVLFERPLLLVVLATRPAERSDAIGLPALHQHLPLFGEAGIVGKLAFTLCRRQRVGPHSPLALLARAIALLFGGDIPAPDQRRMFERAALRLRALLAVDPRPQRGFELAETDLPFQFRPDTRQMRPLETALVQEGQLLIATAQPPLFDPGLLRMHLDWKALRAALIVWFVLAFGKLPKLRLELLLAAQQIEELG